MMQFLSLSSLILQKKKMTLSLHRSLTNCWMWFTTKFDSTDFPSPGGPRIRREDGFGLSLHVSKSSYCKLSSPCGLWESLLTSH